MGLQKHGWPGISIPGCKFIFWMMLYIGRLVMEDRLQHMDIIHVSKCNLFCVVRTTKIMCFCSVNFWRRYGIKFADGYKPVLLVNGEIFWTGLKL